MEHYEHWPGERVETLRGVCPRGPSWGFRADLGLTADVRTGGVGPRYLSLCPNLHYSAHAVQLKRSACLTLPLLSVPDALRCPHW